MHARAASHWACDTDNSDRLRALYRPDACRTCRRQRMHVRKGVGQSYFVQMRCESRDEIDNRKSEKGVSFACHYNVRIQYPSFV